MKTVSLLPKGYVLPILITPNNKAMVKLTAERLSKLGACSKAEHCDLFFFLSFLSFLVVNRERKKAKKKKKLMGCGDLLLDGPCTSCLDPGRRLEIDCGLPNGQAC